MRLIDSGANVLGVGFVARPSGLAGGISLEDAEVTIRQGAAGSGAAAKL